MLSCRFSLFCLVGILCICLCVGSSNIKKCAETYRQALLKLKDGFIDEEDVLSSWNGEDCCKWKGISCNNLTGHVTSLNLENLYFFEQSRGKLDSSICELQHLTSINLSGNHLKGKIPKCIGSLGQLIELKLAVNELVSVIPPTLGNLSNLQILDLGSNNLATDDLEWISHLSKLRYLDLSNMNLSHVVDWLSSISKIPSLLELDLYDCGLGQVNPKSIPHMNSSTSLKILNLSQNKLNSSTVSWVINVSKVLTHLDLSSNSLHSIPDGFANLIFLEYLDLSFNELEGNLPKFFHRLCQLKELRLNSNNLFGQFNDCIQPLSCARNSLESLDLSNNPINSGSLPNFSWLSSLTTLSLRNTNIVGSLPQSFGHLPNLLYVDLSYNQLSGSLPLFQVRKLSSLETLDLSNNQLTGRLPYTIGQFPNLRNIYLSSNKLNGVINEAHLSNLSRLEGLYVARNSFSFNLSSNWVPPFQLETFDASSCNLGPKFPSWLKHQQGLVELDISNSGISDLFPKWFQNLSSSLLYLNVSHNKLSGALPKSLPGMKQFVLGVWDFSFNHLSGQLPPFPGLFALFLSNNMFSGSFYLLFVQPHPYL